MKAKPVSPHSQRSFLYPDLIDQLDPKDPLLLLAKKIPWEQLENDFTPFYAERGRPAKPIRLMVGLLILKQVENLSDERVVEEWRRNPYFQAFCGMKTFQWKLPCEPSDFCHFRKRIGEKGFEKIFQISVSLHGKNALESEIIVDTTVQEKNITYPTDTKLRVKVISRCLKVAEAEKIKLRRSYRRELKEHLRTIRFNRNKNTKLKNHSIGRIKTIANALLSEIARKLPPEKLQSMSETLAMWHKAVNQQRMDKNKIYSLHEPDVFCIAKGKEHKKYEFGNKVVIAHTENSGIIVGAQNAFNDYDGNTLPSLLCQVEGNQGKRPKVAYCDRGFRGKKEIEGTKIAIPESTPKEKTEHYKRKARKKFRRRSAIEGINSHLKFDFRMLRNFLKGIVGDTINLLMAAAAFNFKKWLWATALKLFVLFFASLFWSKDGPCYEYGGA